MGTSPSNTLELSVSDPSGHEYSVDFESNSFASGEHRQCYIGTLNNLKAPKNNKKIVLKVFKPKYVTEYGADYECVKDLERSIICHEYCIKFNKAMREYSQYTIPISFPAPLRINIKSAKTLNINDKASQKLIKTVFNSIPIQIKDHKYLTCQLYLKNGEQYQYKKLTSNNGWTDDTNTDYQFLSAFSHFSWVQSKGKLLINGFQGIQRGHVLFLSDAVIHSDKVGKNGNNDLGIIGICNFFLNHVCNECCKHLPTLNTTLLIEYLSESSILKPQKANTYLFELNQNEIEKDIVNLDTVYGESIQHTFTAKASSPKNLTAAQAGNKVSEQIHDKMEQIEHVVDHILHQKVAGVVEEEENDGNDDRVSSDDFNEGIIEEEEVEEEVEIIHPNLNVSWFGDDDFNEEDQDIDTNFIHLHHEQGVGDNFVAEHNEWEMI